MDNLILLLQWRKKEQFKSLKKEKKKNIDILHDQIKAVEEDPVKVVDCIVDNITYAAPPMNNLPGWQAKAIM